MFFAELEVKRVTLELVKISDKMEDSKKRRKLVRAIILLQSVVLDED